MDPQSFVLATLTNDLFVLWCESIVSPCSRRFDMDRRTIYTIVVAVLIVIAGIMYFSSGGPVEVETPTAETG